MLLSEYLESNNISYADFAKQIGAKSRSTVSRYINGTRKAPNREMMENISRATGGAVTANDFYGLPLSISPTKKVNKKSKPS